ncbi:MAG: ABC transporter ATP-binding protein [Geminicoccaceae bacterium]|nr:ABC transporter ATP-binding protein [Geminicoccaceae bacterium]
MYRQFERLLDPLAPAPVEQPPAATGGFFRYFLDPLRGLVLATLAASGVAAISELLLYAFLGVIVDWMADTPRGAFLSEHGWALFGMFVITILIRPLATFGARGLVTLTLTPGLTNLVRWRSHRYVLRQSLGFFQNDFAGRVAQKVMQSGQALREAVLNVIDGVWFMVIYLVGTIAIFLTLDTWLILPMLVWIAAYGVVVWRMVPPVRDRSRAVSEANSALSGRIVDGYTNIHVVKLFAHAEREDLFGREGMQRHLDAFRRLMRSIFTMTVTLTALNALLIFAMAALSIGLWLQGSVSVGSIAIANGLVVRLTQMSGWILRTVTSLFESWGTVENAVETIARPNAVADRPDAQDLEVPKGEVRFERVSFGYGRDVAVVDDLTLRVRPGEKVGLVGRSGAGKSTLVNLLLRFYDLESGRILIDGRDVASVTQESLRARIGVVTQEPSLLHRSIRDNIAYGRPDATEAQLRRAADLAAALDFIPSLRDPQGLGGFDAHVGERGVKLSGGQRQRIAIARVILKDAPILILDEATSALDSEVEAAIQEQLRHLMAGKTVLAIAHRLSTIATLDRLVVMDEGRIVEEGSHRDLVRKGGLYARLWERQSGGFLDAVDA